MAGGSSDHFKVFQTMRRAFNIEKGKRYDKTMNRFDMVLSIFFFFFFIFAPVFHTAERHGPLICFM